MRHPTSNGLQDLLPDADLPWLMRLRPLWGWILTFIFGCGGVYVAYLQYGWQSLHGIWIAMLILVGYYYLQLYFRLRFAVGKIISERSTPAVDKKLTDSVAEQVGKELNPKITELKSKIWTLESSVRSIRHDIAYENYKTAGDPRTTLEALTELIKLEDHADLPSQLPEWLDHVETLLKKGDVPVGGYLLQDLESCLARFADSSLRNHVSRIRHLLSGRNNGV